MYSKLNLHITGPDRKKKITLTANTKVGQLFLLGLLDSISFYFHICLTELKIYHLSFLSRTSRSATSSDLSSIQDACQI